MLDVRSDEPEYSFLWDKETKAVNQHGNLIDLVNEDSELHCQSLNINNDPSIGDNPNRYKQHGFFLNADNCIGCHACEAACSEKNDNPAHIAFRSVGFVEGGTYPDYQRINISMACNHCDDPVCLKGCPTRAYTKYAEYGAVLQDPDICFGCGYCTWVCPYNAPQLDPVKGEVTKCNMCVDRLEVGLKPACVSACLGNALDFGVIENIPENRIEAKTAIPGFPTTDITQPNIRFQQTRSTHREMTRTDSMPLKYHKDDSVGIFKPKVDKKHGEKKHFNWRKLLTSHESAHVIFTLSTQAVLGAFLIVVTAGLLNIEALTALNSAAVKLPLLGIMFAMLTYGLLKLNMHLGKPHRFYRGFNNLRLSPLSREIAGVSGFYTFLMAYVFFSIFDNSLFNFLANASGILGALSGLIGLYYMYKIYRIKARPFWDHWQTGSTFFGNTLSYGALLTGLISLPLLSADQSLLTLAGPLMTLVALGLGIELVGHIAHSRAMSSLENEGAASWYLQTTRYGKAWITRNVLLALSFAAALLMLATAPSGVMAVISWSLLAVLMISAGAISRSLFFVLVIPTTMPGAFFVRELHGKFKLNELIETIRTTSPSTLFKHIKDIVVWKKIG